MYVVGVIGNDGKLGRTFVCNTIAECDKAFRVLLDEMCDDHPGFEPFDDECTYYDSGNTYFCGSLEKL